MGRALITGGARRIGRALVTAAADAGYDVAIHVRQVDDVYQRDRSEFRKEAKLWLVKWKKEYREKV